MGMLDQELLFSSAQAVSAIGDTPSTNVYDCAPITGVVNGLADNGQLNEEIWLVATVNTAFTGTTGTLQVVLQDSPDNATWTDRQAGAVYALAALTQGAVLYQAQPPVMGQRYYRLVYRVATAVMTAGAVDGYMANTIQRNIFRNSGIPAVG